MNDTLSAHGNFFVTMQFIIHFSIIKMFDGFFPIEGEICDIDTSAVINYNSKPHQRNTNENIFVFFLSIIYFSAN